MATGTTLGHSMRRSKQTHVSMFSQRAFLTITWCCRLALAPLLPLSASVMSHWAISGEVSKPPVACLQDQIQFNDWLWHILVYIFCFLFYFVFFSVSFFNVSCVFLPLLPSLCGSFWLWFCSVFASCSSNVYVSFGFCLLPCFIYLYIFSALSGFWLFLSPPMTGVTPSSCYFSIKSIKLTITEDW